MLSYSEAKSVLLHILNTYIKEVDEKNMVRNLVESGSWKAAIYEIDNKKVRPLAEYDRQKLKDIFGLYC